MTPLLQARGIALSHRLKPTDLECKAGEMVAVIGPNGAGKTSLLRALAAVELERGTVEVEGENVVEAPPARKMRLLSFLPATRALVWPINVRDVIALGLPKVDATRVQEMIDLLDLTALADRPVNSLSTGERSRVLFARALVMRPRLLLLDEPLSNLDPYWVLTSLGILKSAVAEANCTALATLHNLEHVGAFDRVLLIAQGRIIADDHPDEIFAREDFRRAFRIERHGAGWRVCDEFSSLADQQSLR